jgi:Tol biopolymer transport system component
MPLTVTKAHLPRRGAFAAAFLGILAALVIAPSAFATFPDRDGQIVFGADTGSGSQLYTVRPNGHARHQVTHVNGDARHPDWSPDGRRITFALETEAGASIELMNADGSGLTDLTPRSVCCTGQPSFSRDGRRIIFDHYDPELDQGSIRSMKLDGSDQRLLIGPLGEGTYPHGATDANVSPDGRSLSFVGDNRMDFGQALFTANVDGSGPVQLTPFSFDVAVKQDWAPDGRRLVFTDNADFPNPGDSANIATIRPDGTGLRHLTHYPSGSELNAFVGGYSPSGHSIVFRLEDHGRYGLFRMRPDGSHLRAILGLSDIKPRFIDWGPRPRK